MSSPVAGLVEALMASTGPQNEFSVFVDEAAKRRLLHGAFDAFYAETDATTVFDTSRAWSARLPLLLELYPQARFIACVRNPAWIMDSVESLVRRNVFQNSRLFQPGEQATVFSRAEALKRPNRMIGSSLASLQQAYYSEEAGRLLLVEYDILCQRPGETMDLIYGFLGLERFEHDFENVEYDAEEFDRHMGTPGLHTVRREVRWKPRRTILPPQIFEDFARLAFWADATNTRALRIVAQEAAGAGA